MTPLKLKYVKIILLVFIVSGFFITTAISSFLIGRLSKEESPHFEKAFVIQVIDGDTIKLDDGRVVRYIGIDSPEIDSAYSDAECFGTESADLNRILVEGKVVELASGIEDLDMYGRYLRYVYVDGMFVNAQLVAEGAAYASRYGPEKRFHQIFVQLEQYSKLLNRGMWDVCQ